MPVALASRCAIVSALLAFTTFVAWASPVHADDARDETRRWVTSAALSLGVTGQSAEASVATSTLIGSAPPEPVRPPTQGSRTLIDPRFELGLELMTPRFADRFGRPRAFVQAAFGANFGFDYDVASEGELGRMNAPTVPIFEGNYSGQGSATTAQVAPIGFRAGLGAAFTFDVGHARMRIKPSLQYLHQEVDVAGFVNRAVALDPQPTTNFRVIQLSASERRAYDALGPGIEYEVDAARMGPFTLTPFVNFQAFAILDNDAVVLTDSDPDAVGTETAQWTYRNEGWIYAGAAGLRLRWAPE